MLKDFAKTSPVTFFALPIIIMGLLVLSYFLYSTLLNNQIDARSTYLMRQLEISIGDIDEQVEEFEEEIPFLSEIDNFREVFNLEDKNAGKLRYRIKRLCMRYNQFIDTIFVYDKFRYYYIDVDSSGAVIEGFGILNQAMYPLQFTRKPKIVHVHGNKSLAMLPTDVLDTENPVFIGALFDITNLIGVESDQQYIGERGYKIIFSENSGFNMSHRGRDVEYDYGLQKNDRKELIDKLLEGKSGSMVHHTSQQGPVFLSVYKSFELFSEQFGLIFAVSEKDFIAPIRTKLQIIFISFFLIIAVIIVVFVINLRDISSNTAQLEKSRESLARALTILEAQQETFRDGLIVTDESGRIVSINRQVTTMFEHESKPLKGSGVKKCMEYISTLAVDEEEVMGLWKSISKDDNLRQNVEIKLKDGRSVDFYSAPIMDETEVNNGRIWTFRDITERKNQILELETAKERALAGAREKENFLSTMSHEIRTPLNSIVGFANLLMREDPREDQREQIEPLKYSADSLLNLINDILDLTKIESGNIEFEKIPFNLNEKLTKASQVFNQSAREKDLSIVLNLDESISNVFLGDYNRLNQIVYNMVSNAIKFTNEGSVEIGSKLMSEVDQQEVVQVWVKDTGIGIDKHKQEEIFKSFHQADSNTTREYGGTGLGLAITKKLVDLQDGRIWVISKPGQGSTFTVEMKFPVTQLEEKEEVNIDNLNLDGLYVMVVEDNPFNQKVVNRFLERWGAKTILCESGEMALSVIMDERVDLILMDLQMPEMDGYETTRAIRALKPSYYKNLPIVAMSADALGDVKEKVSQAGMNDYVSKPFDPDHLLTLLARYNKEPV